MLKAQVSLSNNIPWSYLRAVVLSFWTPFTKCSFFWDTTSCFFFNRFLNSDICSRNSLPQGRIVVAFLILVIPGTHFMTCTLICVRTWAMKRLIESLSRGWRTHCNYYEIFSSENKNANLKKRKKKSAKLYNIYLLKSQHNLQ